jgi:hypothetical protein
MKTRRTIQPLPAGSVLDGELHAPGCAASEAIAAARSGSAVLSVFAAPLWAGRGVDDLEESLDLARAAGFSVLDAERLAPADQARPADYWADRARREGLEGFVLKQSAREGWHRAKAHDTLDCVVTGWRTATGGSRAGTPCALRLADTHGRDLGHAGLAPTHHLRDADPEQLVGRIAEILHDGRTRTGRLRCARFIRWRPDKGRAASGLLFGS